MNVDAHRPRPHAANAMTPASRPLSRRGFLSGVGLLAAGTAASCQLARIDRSHMMSEPVRGFDLNAMPAAQLASATIQPLTKSGLYSYGWDYVNNRSAVCALGATALRTSNSGMYPAAYQAMKADGVDTHVTITGTNRASFSSDAAWIADYLGQVDTYLAQFPVAWVEVWNEPNFGMWTGATAAQKQLSYGNLLVATYAHIKNNWPGVGVVGFGAGDASAAAPGFIKGVLQAVPAAARSFDVCSLHPYLVTTAPESVRTEAWGSWTIAGQVQALRRAGITTPIWFTEVGYQIPQSAGGKFSEASTATISPALQAAYRVRMYMLCLKLGVARLNHMYVVDTNGYNGGFFDAAKQPRPQATAFAMQQKTIGCATAIEALIEGPRVWSYLVTTPQGQVVVAWSDAGANLPSFGFSVSGGSDIYGNALVAESIQLSSSPVYLPVMQLAEASPSSTAPVPATRHPRPHKPRPRRSSKTTTRRHHRSR